MAFQKGDVVLVPLPFTDLRAAKVRPAAVLSAETYHATEPDLVLGAVTTNLSAATAPVDYVLADWAAAGLRYPSAFKPILFTLEPALILHHVGSLSAHDLAEVERRLRRVFDLAAPPLGEMLPGINLGTQPVSLVQTLAEQAITVICAHAGTDSPDARPDRLQALLAQIT